MKVGKGRRVSLISLSVTDLLGVVEDNSQRIPAAIVNPADSVTHIDPVKAARTPDRPIARGEYDRRTLFEHHRIASGLRARPLFEQQKFSAGIVCTMAAQHKGELQRKGDFAVKVLMHAVITAGLIAQEQRRGPGLAAAMALLKKIVQGCRKAEAHP